jgi:hypothetical protein
VTEPFSSGEIHLGICGRSTISPVNELLLIEPFISDASGGGGGRQVNTFAMNMNASTEGQLRSRRKAAKMLVAVVVMFAFCYFPVHLLSILR